MHDDLAARLWDVVVVGTGMGGGFAARHLAEAGLSVLMLEKGPRPADAAAHAFPDTPDPELRQAAGAWPAPLELRLNGVDSRVFASIGSGVGGSSAFYAATLERPEPHDLDDLPGRPHPTGGWPVSSAGMEPWFDRAQRICGLSGEPDPLGRAPTVPLAPPAPEVDGETRLKAAFAAAGLHPYTMHSAIRRIDGCANCVGRLCPRPCKMDGRSAGVEPALATGHAALVTGAEVRAIATEGPRATVVRVECGGRMREVRARHVILAAGAFGTPRVLFASHGEAAPAGLGNAHDQVGRNLMFHLNEIFAIWPPRGASFPEAPKSIAFRDFYHLEGQRLGMVQAMGLNLGRGEVLHQMRQRLARSRWRRVPGARQMLRVPAAVAAATLGPAKVFVGLIEDLPSADNRVLPPRPGDGPDALRARYDVTPELEARRRLFRRRLHQTLSGQRLLFLNRQAEPNFGHGCGTARMGHDPATSVVDADCRVHGMANLWVADASVFPTSMGVNPSLTIAANALRVADAVAAELRRGE